MIFSLGRQGICVQEDREKELDKISDTGARVKKDVKKHGFKLELHGLAFKGMSTLSIKTFCLH